MDKRDLIRRYIIFLPGLLLTSFGIAMTTKSGLGTSPNSAIPYSLSLIYSELSLGQWTFYWMRYYCIRRLFSGCGRCGNATGRFLCKGGC